MTKTIKKNRCNALVIKWKIVTMFIVFFVFLSLPNAVAQTHDFESWSGLTVKKKIKDDYSLQAEASIRRRDIQLKRAQEYYQLTAGYKINDLFTTRLALATVLTKRNPDNGANLVIGEFDIIEDLIITKKKEALTFSYRLRLEQRFIQDKAYDADAHAYKLDGSSFKNRLRNRFALKITLDKENKLSIQIYEELFLDQKSYLLPESFNQNWSGLNLTYKVKPFLVLGIGYQHRLTKPDGKFASVHIVQPTITFSF